MNLIVRATEEADLPRLKELWQTAFHNTPPYLDFFFRESDIKDCGLAVFDGETLVSMLFLMPAVLRAENASYDARYVYAVATHPAYRGSGIMTALEERAAAFARAEGASCLALVPAQKSLFSLYERLGYRTRFYLSETLIPKSLDSRAVLTPCLKSDFLEMRKRFLEKKKCRFELSPALCEFRYEEYLRSDTGFITRELFLVETREGIGYTAGYLRDAKTYVIQETDLTGGALAQAAGALSLRHNTDRILVIGGEGRRKPYGMLKILDSSLDGKNIKLLCPYMNLMME